MASLLTLSHESIRLLDAGAGAGALTAAVVDRLVGIPIEGRPAAAEFVAYENDVHVLPALRSTHRGCLSACRAAGIAAAASVRDQDFIEAATSAQLPLGFTEKHAPFTTAILNPPYGKFRRGSPIDAMLKAADLDCTNLYSAFLILTARMLAPGGELVAIVPRSFCNGPYFRAFRRDFLRLMTFTRLHVFDERGSTFGDDAVLQENIVFRAVRTPERRSVVISASTGIDDSDMSLRTTDHDEIVWPTDPRSFIRLLADDVDAEIARRMASLPATLADLRLTVSTGPVVDFRMRAHLRTEPDADTVPLVYPTNLRHSAVLWPVETRKPQAMVDCDATRGATIPAGTYVLVKRFSAKEERRRVVPAVLTGLPGVRLGIENHLNYFHREGQPLDDIVATGLLAYLRSSLVDLYFRQFNGHTQVNATDLRSLRYPTTKALRRLGLRVRGEVPSQEQVDAFVQEVLFPMSNDHDRSDPVAAKQRVHDAREILRQLGFPKEQHNKRSGLVLLALTDVRPESAWADATAPLMGITPTMTYIADHYGTQYAPNTRETIRRRTIHQFVDAGFAVLNPDDPNRAVNRQDNVYQLNPNALGLIRNFGTGGWAAALEAYRQSAGTLKSKYAKQRKMVQIPVEVAAGTTVELTPGGQNVLVEKILHEFCPRFTPRAETVYVGDAGKKWAYFDDELMNSLGVSGIDPHGKFPDVVVYHRSEGWLVLIEAVTSHGPVDPKRHSELKELFRSSTAGLVFVTAFLDRAAFVKYVREIAWETEVWTADSPGHLIHFDGERFLGPYDPPPAQAP